jgi:multidrug efflux pump subunit AcrA (membrane-fusion protein)
MTLFFPQVQAAQAALAEVHAEAAEAAAAAEARLAAAAELAAGQQQQLQQRVFELQGEVDSLRAQLQQNQVCFFWGGGMLAAHLHSRLIVVCVLAPLS